MRFSPAVKTLSLLILTLGTPAVFAADAVKAPAAAQADQSKTPVLSRAEFDKLLAQPEQLLIIDIRRPDELTAIGGLPVYLSIQLSDLEKRLAWIPKDRKIVTVSNHASRAGKAGDLLAAKGFKVVGRVGVQNYEEEGGKLTKIAPKAAAATAQAK